MIEAVILDFGNVICNFTNEILIERLSDLNGKNKEETRDLIYKKSDITKRFETGLLNSEEFYWELKELVSVDVSLENLKEIYSKDKFTPVEGMEKLVKSLQNKGYKIGLLSNTSEWDWNYMIRTAPIIKTFDTIITSFETRAMKPNPKIFKGALEKMKLDPKKCVYTDDIADYVEAAKKVGLEAIQFTGVEKFRIDLENLGLEF